MDFLQSLTEAFGDDTATSMEQADFERVVEHDEDFCRLRDAI